ncbi:MAG: ATP-dependent helicase [Acidimicrobiaceae bacterium]|nr:ATP-dependent helicase [Acidimicrobiaceae bacterium]
MHADASERDPRVGEMASVLRGLDPQQREAVTIDAAPLAIVAAAGSGKTTVLTRRIARRIIDGSADARHVLALTFTRDAAGELRRRLRRLEIREPIESGTFHAVALRVLRDRALGTGGTPPSVANDRFRLIREVLTETRVRCEPGAALGDLDWARARLVPTSEFVAANRRVRRRPALSNDAFAAVLDAYTALKRRRGVVDFDDLLAGMLGEMRQDLVFADVVRWRFRHLFVDEAQDLNPLQHALLEEIRGGRPDICLVGDHRQAIYGWNGADPTTLLEVETHYPGVTVVSLTGNYRCSPQVVRAGAAALAAASIDDDTESRRPDGRPLRVIACADEHDEAAVVASMARDLVHRHGARHVAVLARTNEQLDALGRALSVAGVPIARAVGTSVLDRTVLEASRCTSRDQLAHWIESVWAADAVDPIRGRVAEEADRFLSSNEPGGFRTWLEVRQPFDDLATDDEGAVSLLTFHAAKGREWEAVVVTGVEDGLVPHASAGTVAQRAEEARLLYVALTRASDALVVTWAGERRGRAAAASPWLAAVSATIEHQRRAAPPADWRRPPRAPEPLQALKEWRATVARAAGVAPAAVCSDQVLRSMLADPPTDVAQVAVRLGLGIGAAERLAPKLLTLLPAAPA